MANSQKNRPLWLLAGYAHKADNPIFAAQGGPNLAQQALVVGPHEAVLVAARYGQLHHYVYVFKCPDPYFQFIRH